MAECGEYQHVCGEAGQRCVCHVTTVHSPFDIRIFHKECRSLVQAGYEVHIVARHSGDEVVDGVKIHALPSPPGRLARMLWWPWLAYRKALAIEPRPVLFHLHDPELLPVGMALRFRGLNVLYDVHENVADQIRFKEYLPRPARWMLSWGYRLCERIMISGMGTVHVLDSIAAGYGGPKTVLRNLPWAGDVDKLRLDRKHTDLPTMVYVGAISRVRGAMTMIQLAYELRRRGHDFRMRLVGPVNEAGLEEQLRQEIDRAGLSEHVELVGKVPYEQAQVEAGAADIGLCLLHPIPNYLNSLATKIFEYMRAGVPVVATDIPAWRDHVTGVGSGLQVDVGRIDQIADATERLLADVKLRRSMGRKGRQAVLNEFCWEREQEKLLAFYDRQIKGRRAEES